MLRGFDVLRGFLYPVKVKLFSFIYLFISSFTFSFGDLAVRDWYNLLDSKETYTFTYKRQKMKHAELDRIIGDYQFII